MATQSKLAGYIGIERPAILTALGLLPDDLTGLDQLWEQFAQLAATGTVGEGKTLSLVDALPETGDENTYYGLKSAMETEISPLTDPVADVPFNAFITDSPDLSGVTLDTPVTVADDTVNNILQASLASTIFADVISGGSSRLFWFFEEFDTITVVYLDGEVATSGETYPAGWYVVSLSGGLPVVPFLQAIDYEEDVKPATITVVTMSQEAIDNGFAAVFMTFTDEYSRGFYSFDGANYNLEIDLTDFNYKITENAIEISSLRLRVEALEAWMAQAESAAEAANGGV